MKWMIASDLHGSAYYCKKMVEAFEREGADRLLMLGDLLYHGPRNDLPRDYAPKEVIPMLNGLKNKLCCVRGNCEAEVDQKEPAAAGRRGHPAPRPHPRPGVDGVRAEERLPQPRLPEHPEGKQSPQLYDP